MPKAKKDIRAEHPLTLKQERFAAEYVKDLNATNAAMRAGYSEKTAHVQGCTLLKNPKVVEEIARFRKEISSERKKNMHDIVNEYEALAFSNVSDIYEDWQNLKDFEKLPVNIKKSISEINFRSIPTKEGIETQIRIKMHDKIRALENLEQIYSGSNTIKKITVSLKKRND
jgi:phage terminase small subunit